jgi:hypothetical protein
MKSKLIYLFTGTAAGALLGFGGHAVLEKQRSTADLSVAGQTLLDLARALETAKDASGAYPDSIDGISIVASGGDFSQAALQRVVYRKTADGYVAFVGNPRVAFIEPGKGAHFK